MRTTSTRALGATCIVGLLSALLGCSPADRNRGGVTRFRVNQDEGFLVVARHERQSAVITETVHEAVSYEVAMTGPGGEFTLKRPSSRRGKRTVTRLIISKPGFRVFTKQQETSDVPRQIDLAPTNSYGDEYAAAAGFERAVHTITPGLDKDQQAMVQTHIAARQAFLKRTYPADVAAAEKRRQRRAFRHRKGLTRRALAVAALPGDGLALLSPSNAGRDLLIVDGKMNVTATVALSDPDSAALARDAKALAVVNAGAIRQFDFAGKPLASVSLDPAPSKADTVTSLTRAPGGFLIALGPSLAMDGTRKPCRVRHYAASGKMTHERELPSMLSVNGAFMAPDGAIVIAGSLAGPFASDVEVAGLKKVGAMPKGIVRLANWSADPTVMMKGIDSAVSFGSGVFAYASGLYAAADKRLATSGQAGLLEKRLLEVSWDGKIVAAHDVTDTRVGMLALGVPLDSRLVLFAESNIYELDLAALRGATP